MPYEYIKWNALLKDCLINQNQPSLDYGFQNVVNELILFDQAIPYCMSLTSIITQNLIHKLQAIVILQMNIKNAINIFKTLIPLILIQRKEISCLVVTPWINIPKLVIIFQIVNISKIARNPQLILENMSGQLQNTNLIP